MALEQADPGAMIRAAGQVEASHQQIHELQMRLQDVLPRLATLLDGGRFADFQRDYSQFDSQIERVKQGLDLVHSSLTGQLQPKLELRPMVEVELSVDWDQPPPSPEFPAGLPDGASQLAGANAELNSLLNALDSVLVESMPSWDPDARGAWREARRSWAEANRRQSEILHHLGGHGQVPGP